MPQFSAESRKKLMLAHDNLARVFERVVTDFDCTILCSYRDKIEQEKAFDSGHSDKHFPNSKHNSMPSLAIDVVPYPVDWEDTDRMRYFAGQVVATARAMNIKIRWGGDWNKNTELKDEHLKDLPHFELIDKEIT